MEKCFNSPKKKLIILLSQNRSNINFQKLELKVVELPTSAYKDKKFVLPKKGFLLVFLE